VLARPGSGSRGGMKACLALVIGIDCSLIG